MICIISTLSVKIIDNIRYWSRVWTRSTDVFRTRGATEARNVAEKNRASHRASMTDNDAANKAFLV